MKTDSTRRLIITLFFTALFVTSGCYTVLMHPSLLTSSEKEYTPQDYLRGDFTSEISYNQNCLNCHSQTELDDRYYDMGRVGMQFAHGMSIDPYGWRRPTTSLPWWNGIFAPLPPAVSISAPGTTESGPRRRPTGSTRGDDGTKAAVTPGATTTTATAPATSPAVSDTRGSTQATPQGTSTDRTRTTTAPAPSKEPPKRKSGSTRGDDPK